MSNLYMYGPIMYFIYLKDFYIYSINIKHKYDYKKKLKIKIKFSEKNKHKIYPPFKGRIII